MKTYKYTPLQAPVALEEIEAKLPICSFLCKRYNSGCSCRIDLNTVDPLQVVTICMAGNNRP